MSPIVYDNLPIERIIARVPAAQALADEVEHLGRTRIYVLSSRTLNRETDVVSSVVSILGERCVGVFDSIGAHAPLDDVINFANALRETNADLIVTIGGGSVIDGAKVAQFCLARDISTPEEFSDHLTHLNNSDAEIELSTSSVRQIVVPTTLSAAEFSNLGGTLNRETKEKKGVSGANFCAQTIIFDPAVTVHTPEWLWLSSGLRAVDHCVEGYCSKDSHPYVEGQVLHALRLFSHSLRRTKRAPDDLEARSLSQQAEWLTSSCILRVSFGASHALSYGLGGLAEVPHGLTSCVLLPAVLRWNESVDGERQAAIADALGSPDKSASTSVLGLIKDLDLPSRIRDVGVEESLLPAIANYAIKNPWMLNNPRPVTSIDDAIEILKMAW
jgi:alcohol dehydrogenase class IV